MPTAAAQAGVADAPGLRIQLLGAFRVWVGAQLIPDSAWRAKTARLLKLLALGPGHRLHREQVLEWLWPDFEPQAATNNLHRTLHAARRVLEPHLGPANPSAYLQLLGESVGLSAPGALWIDVEAFEVASAVARHTREPAAYEAALELYGGELLPEDRYEDWVSSRREGLRGLYVGVLVELAEQHEDRGERLAAIRALQQAVATEPAHEAAHVDLMRLLAQTGQRHRALRQYQQLVEALRQELDAEPDPASQGLYQAILGGQIPPHRPPSPELAKDGHRPARAESPEVHRAAGRVLDGDRPASGVPGTGPTNLPRPLSSFVGRERERAELTRLLGATRLLTLTGAVGVGKTRLAVEVAANPLGACPDGVWVVDLARLADPRLVPRAVAGVLGLQEEPGRPLLEALVEFLGPRRALLVLDNCERLVGACAELAEALLGSCPQLRILATSRVPLGVAGTVWRVSPLASPDPEHLPPLADLPRFDAVQLFLQRAQTSRPDFALTTEKAMAVARICRRLDGIPLALELAAARLNLLSVAELADRLDDSLKLLVGGGQTAPPRHQALRAALDWSHELLGESERVLFRRLAVFDGGWTLEAVEAVCADNQIEEAAVLELLAELMDKSLVGAGEHARRGRYLLLGPVQQYAAEQLRAAGEAAQVRGRHLAWCLALAEAAEPELVGPEQAVWLERLESEHANLGAALGWAMEQGDAEPALRLTAALWRFWEAHGHLKEGQRWLEAALARSSSERTTARANALNAAGNIAYRLGQYERAAALHGASLALKRELGDRLEIALSANNLGKLARLQGDYGRAAALHTESLDLWRELGDRWGMAVSLNDLAVLAQAQDEAVRAAGLWGAAEVLRQSIGCPLPVEDRSAHEQAVAAARTSLGDAAFAVAWGAGRALPLEQAIAEALAVGERGPGTEDAPSHYQAALTRRERELAALLAAGRTNRQIAQALGIAERTVDTHVGRILRKLGLVSRAQVAAWAAEQGLLVGGAR